MNARPCCIVALTASVFACSSSTPVAPDAGSGTKDSGTMHKMEGGSKTDSGGKPDAKPHPDAKPGSGPCEGVTGTCVPIVVGESESDIDTAFEIAKSGTTLAFEAGTFSFTNTLALLGTPKLTIKGAGIDKTILDFSKQTAGADGLDAQSSNGLTLFGFTVQDTKGNAIKVLSSTDVIFESVKTAWTTPAQTSNGPYGIYPVSVTNLLIDHCVITGASDSGVYVGQSTNAVVTNNDVYGNVAGIEIENTFGARVENNTSHDNTGGILVFDLPNLPQQGGHDIRVVNNQVTSNNLHNFGASGDIVSKVPAGTGILVMANHDVEVTGNTVTSSNTVGIAVVSYLATLLPITDPKYYPYPRDVSVHDNTLSMNGAAPDGTVDIGLLIASAASTFPGQRAPDLIYDGAFDPAVVADAGAGPDGGANADPMSICFQNNGASSTFVDINIPKLVVYGVTDAGADATVPPDAGLTNLPLIDSFNLAPFTCSLPAPATVDGGVTFSDAGI